MNSRTPIKCKCGTWFIPEEHPPAAGSVNEIGLWYTCPGCFTTGVLLSPEFQRQMGEHVRGEVFCPHCRRNWSSYLKSNDCDRCYCRGCRQLIAYSFDEIFSRVWDLIPMTESLSPRPARNLTERKEVP